jgi:hypothetical protein
MINTGFYRVGENSMLGLFFLIWAEDVNID